MDKNILELRRLLNIKKKKNDSNISTHEDVIGRN